MNGVNWSNVDKAIARGDVIAPEVWNGLDSVIAGMPFFAPKRASESIGVKISANTASNRASIESDMADVAITPSPPPQVQIDPSPLTDDEIAYGQRIANDPRWTDGAWFKLEYDENSNAHPVPANDAARRSVSEGGVREAVSVTIETDETARELELVEAERHALSVMAAETVPPTSETTPPSETHGQTDTRPRPKGMTKLRSKVWDWIDQHAGDGHSTDTLSVNKVKAGAGCARGVAGEMLALYRSWYADTRQQAS